MQPKDNRDSFNKKVYEVHTFYNNSVQLKRLPFELFHVAIAKFSGPIAMYLNKFIPTDLTFSSEEEDFILMYSNKGTVFNKVPFYTKQKILFFEFFAEQVLMVGTEKSYFLIDPYRSSVKMLDLSENFKNDKVLGYKIFQSFIYVIVGRRVFEIRNIHQPIPKQKAILNINTSNPVIIFEPMSGSNDFQMIYFHERKQIYSSETGNQIIECKPLSQQNSRLMFINRHIDNSNVYYILVFHSPFKIGYYVNGSSTFYEPPSIKTIQQPQLKKSSSSRHHSGNVSDNGYSCAWIQDTVYLSNKMWIIRLNDRGLNILRDQKTLICQDIDGIRLYGQNSQILRLASKEYLSILKDSKNSSLLQLYEAFEQYQNNEVVNLQLLQNNSGHKQQNLEIVIKAAQFSLDPLEQMRILKFGIFFKTYYCMKTNLNQLCEQLRLINNLKYQVVNRCLTLTEFRYLKNNKMDEFVSILLRYNLHYVADLIGGGEKVYFHWAKCKIQKERQDIALNQIVKKFNSYKEKQGKELSYVDIARYAIQTKRFQVAQSLIEYETNIKKKVMILLWMATLKKDPVFLQKALDNADKSLDSDTINRVIFEVQKQNIVSQNITKLIDKRPTLQNHYLQYLKVKNPTKLKNYFVKRKQNQQLGLLALKSYLAETYKSTQSFDLVKKLLPNVAQSQNTSKSSQYAVFLKKALNPGYQINSSQIQKFKKQKNPQFLVQVLIQRDMIDEAVKVIFGMQSDIAFDLLTKIQKWKETIIFAKEKKNKDMLTKLMEVAPNQYKELIVQTFNQLSAK